jgi:DNA-binding CsgD family transcriptional regulator
MDRNMYESLTPMERKCLRLAHHERKAEQIAHELGIRPSTVNAHIFSARRKLGGIPRLSAADQLRRYEAELLEPSAAQDALPPEEPPSGPPLSPPQPLSRQELRMGDRAAPDLEIGHPVEVREQRTPFIYDGERPSSSGGSDGRTDDILRRVALILAIALLAALVAIASPAIYDSAAQRIANSLERPHTD